MKDLGEGKMILSMGSLETQVQADFGYLEELHSQGVEKIQYVRSKTSHHSFDRSLQVILQAVSTITGRGGGDISSTIC